MQAKVKAVTSKEKTRPEKQAKGQRRPQNSENKSKKRKKWERM